VDNSLGTETHLAEALVDATVGAKRSQQWMHHVIALLDAATRQLRDEDPGAQCTILEASRFLQKQVDPQPAEDYRVERGRLLTWQVRKVRNYIDAHIAERILVRDLGAVVQLSEAHFSRAFKRTFGEPPHSFLLRRRLEFAVHYLLRTDASLSDIAIRCGFSDQPHLCRAFRQAMGLSPALWRRSRRGHEEGNTLVPPSNQNFGQERRVA
jgi:AraC family transcriptional regulator